MFTMDIGTNLNLVFSLEGGPISAKGHSDKISSGWERD
jgi:hypothetical protein